MCAADANHATASGLRIALVVLHADPARGGAERYTLDLARSLTDELGMDARVIATSFGDVALEPEHRVHLPVSGPTRAGRYRSFVRQLAAHLQHARYDVVHAMLPVPPGFCHVYHPHAGVEASGRRALMSVTNPRRALFIQTERRLLRSPTPPIVPTLSQYLEDELRRQYPSLPADRTPRLFNAVDLERYRPDGPTADRAELGARHEGDLVALFVGNDWERKGLHTPLAALQELPSRVRLAVVGEDRPRVMDSFRRLAGDFRVADRVTFLGKRSDLPSLYRAADVLVHHSRHDPCSLATLEALASGLPVLGGRRDGAMEMVEDDVHGAVLQPDGGQAAIDAMATRLRELLDPTVRQRMSDASLALRPRLSWTHHLDQVREIYDRILNSRPAQG